MESNVVNMEAKLEKWKKKLLDLGKKNSLLNFKFTSKSTLEIVNPNFFDLWESFVLNKESLKFDTTPAEELDNVETDEAEDKKEVEDEKKAKVVTNKSSSERSKALRNLMDKSKTFLEEQGVSVLYLCFGYLHWNESSNSNIFYNAPLVLVPVTLTKSSITSPFELSINDDDILLNPTLAFKLESDYGITLSEYDQEMSLEEYLDILKEKLGIGNWEILEKAGLGLLSFLKLNMYKDLDKMKDRAVSNKILGALAGNPADLAEDRNAVLTVDATKFDDEIKPDMTFQVVDADSSQQEAIECAKRGISFVLQGPPGTGKSQTITNIIAESLAAGKKVLFVSEKMAALQVVYKRLKDVGLDDFILLMHNYKANKRTILDQFDNVMRLSSNKIALKKDAKQILDDLYDKRKSLNDYAKELYFDRMPLDRTVYEVNGEIAILKDAPDIIFTVENIGQISSQDFGKCINLLKEYTATVKKMGDDVSTNPWYKCTIQGLNHELRQEIDVYGNDFRKNLQEISSYYDSLERDLQFKVDRVYGNIENVIKMLEISTKGMDMPVSWILGDDIEPFDEEIKGCVETKNRYLETKNNIIFIHNSLKEMDENIGFVVNNSLLNSQEISGHLSEITKEIEAEDIFTRMFSVNDSVKIDKEYEFIEEKIKSVQQIKEKINKEYEKEIFEIDYNTLYLNFKTKYTGSFFNRITRFFSSEYRNTKSMFRALNKNIGANINDDAILTVLGSLRELESLVEELKKNEQELKEYFGGWYKDIDTDLEGLSRKISIYKLINKDRDLSENLLKIMVANEEKESVLKAHYQSLYNGIETDWDYIRKALEWANGFKDSVKCVNNAEFFVDKTCNNPQFREMCSAKKIALEEIYKKFSKNYQWYIGLFEEGYLEQMTFDDLNAHTEKSISNPEALEDWLDYANIKNRCLHGATKHYVEALETEKIKSDEIVNGFEKRFYKLWLDDITSKCPVIGNFRRKNQDDLIHEFKKLDLQQFSVAKARIRQILIDQLPEVDGFTSGVDEISILKKELNKQRRIMPIRKLFGKIPNLIMKLKPCLMMSPLSVSLFLEADSFDFDIVIFDEASQVCTENAVGAILRGKQVVIAGDSKQLPPTNFFNASTSSGEYAEDDDDDVYESVLDEAALLPEKTLLWHYRSRHEHLIAFSNYKIYQRRLVTFPSNIAEGEDVGVEYVYVEDGFYDRGGRKGNVNEAKRIANMVFDHFRKYQATGNKRSLGVIAFGEVQQSAINLELRRMRLEDQSFEEFFREDVEDPFFVKNLENVQGDERDTIIFSIGYAKNREGVMYMNFGPLSKSGGERRLNVAITRAKINIKLVGSILPNDIDTDRVSSDGPKLLRSYIDFAMNGPIVLDATVEERDELIFDSPFEEAVYNYLNGKGYKLATQVGCSGYRIDIAIKHPSISGCYVLAVECDGASYHSSKNARERDRLRQDVLENMGWSFYRIWSTDWIKDPNAEGERLVKAIERAIDNFDNTQSGNVHRIEDAEVLDFEEVVEKETVDEDNPYAFENFKEFEASTSDIMNGKEKKIIKECILFNLKNNSPIHFEILCKQCCNALMKSKVTSNFKSEVIKVLGPLNGQYEMKDDFLYDVSGERVIVQKYDRNIKQVSIEEIGEGMLRVASKRIGMDSDSFISEVARAFGYKRCTSAVKESCENALEKMVSDGKITIMDNKISIK